MYVQFNQRRYVIYVMILCFYFLFGRGGRAGGYKELDEEEIEETKRRRREAEEVSVPATVAKHTWVILQPFYSKIIHSLLAG